MIQSRFLRSLHVVAESALTLLLVGVFFVIVLGFLSIGFPKGTRLAQAMLPESLGGLARPASRRALVLADLGDEPPDGSAIASLASLSGRVMDKSPGAVVWAESRPGTGLTNRHTVQTMSRSRATVSFRDDRDLRMEENSLIIVRRDGGHRGMRRRQSGLIVLEGELRGRLTRTEETRDEIVVVSATREATLRPLGEPGQEVDFSVKVNPDQSSTVAVYTGAAEVTLGAESLRIDANEFVTLTETGALPLPAPLPAAPGLERPSPGSVFRYNSVSTAVEFRWRGDRMADSFEFVLARDAEFQQIILRETVERPSFIHGHLRSGKYYWKVSGLSGWAKGLASEPRRFEVLRDTDPPLLTVRFPEDVVRDATLVLEGTTEPGADVSVGDVRIPVDAVTGEFGHVLQLQPGLNVVVVAAVDGAGNMAHESKIVNAKSR